MSIFEQLDVDYRKARPKYEAFTNNIAILIANLLRANNISHLPIEPRTKESKKFNEKIRRPSKKGRYAALEDVTDLSGVRVVVYYEDDIDAVCNIISNNFLVDEENTVRKSDSLAPDRFGYRSIHYVVSHGETRCHLEENVQFKDLKAEIQIRTVVQHAWASIDRSLRYEDEASIPIELRRKLFRISALLELADKEFSEVKSQIVALRDRYSTQLREGHETELNRDSLEILIRDSKVIKTIKETAESLDYSVEDSPPARTSGLLALVKAAGFTDIIQLETALKDNNEYLDKLIKDYINDTAKDRSSVNIAGLIAASVVGISEENARERAFEVFPPTPVIHDFFLRHPKA